ADGVGAQRFFDREILIDSKWLPVQCETGDRSPDAKDGVGRDDGPIGAECERSAGIDQFAEGERAAQPRRIVAKASSDVAAIIGLVQGLHAGDDAAETSEVRWINLLG